MNVLVTGGAGYLGTELVSELDRNPEIKSILVYDNLSRGTYAFFYGERKLSRRTKFIQADILDSRTLKTCMSGIDVVYHLAAKVTTPFAEQNAHQYTQANQWGTAELSYAIEESNVRSVVFLSSASIYGSSDVEVTERDTPHPETVYGISKLKAEGFLTRLMGQDRSIYIIRCGNIYGFSKNMRFDSVINRFVFNANFQRQISIHGDGKQLRSFVHVQTAAEILSRLVSSPLDSGVYNLVQDTFSVNQIADTLQAIYPDLERTYANQGIRYRQLKVQPNESLNSLATSAIRFPEAVEAIFTHFVN